MRGAGWPGDGGYTKVVEMVWELFILGRGDPFENGICPFPKRCMIHKYLEPFKSFGVPYQVHVPDDQGGGAEFLSWYT